MSAPLTLGTITKQMSLSKLPTGPGYFIYFKLNDHPDLVNEGARLIAARIQSLRLAHPYFVTAEASTIALAHVLRDQHKIPGLILYKHQQINDIDPVSVTYKTVTATQEKQLFLDKHKTKDLLEKDIVIIDSICTTGETLKAIYAVLLKAGIKPAQIKEATVLFAEGEPPLTQIPLDDQHLLNIHSISHLPIIPEQ